MIKVDHLSYAFPQKDLYDNISFTLEAGQHCAFIGSNGSGKTTLIDMLISPDNYVFDGNIEMEPSCHIGYVSQFSQAEPTEDINVFEYIGEKFIRLQQRITELCTQMETASDIEPLLEEYQETLDAFNAIGGDDYESEIHKKLALANLSKHKDLMISELSGGEFKLIQVIKEMLNKPDLMIMDEPDVFLDFENVISLKNLLNAFKNTLLIITHNRYLLNNCFNKIIHLENMQLQEFEGSYIDYNFSLLQTKVELQELSIADDEEIKRNDALIDRLRFIATHYDSVANGKSLNARMKIQERLEARRIKHPFVDIKQPSIGLATDSPLEDTLALKVTDYTAKFDDLLLEHVNFEIMSNDKVAIIGSNGTGKTTLLKDILDNKLDSIEINDDIHIAYLSQVQGEILNESNTIEDEFFDAGFKSYEEIYQHISAYGFDQEMAKQKISSLSGGERNVLQLAKVSAGSSNMLLLDEPTSHLDMHSQVALEQAIQNYNGAILMISHDYYSIINCMDYVLMIDNKTIRKMTMKKFKKMVYANHFDKDYLDFEEKKKAVELKIEAALKASDFELAKILVEELEGIIQSL